MKRDVGLLDIGLLDVRFERKSNVPQSKVHQSKVRAITLGLEQTATLQYNHADCKKEKCDAPPVKIEFFHSNVIIFNGRMYPKGFESN